MVRRIDFLGAPGIGKSTLYKTLLQDKLPAHIIAEPQAYRLALGSAINQSMPWRKRWTHRVLQAIPKVSNYYISTAEDQCSRQVHYTYMYKNEVYYRAASDCMAVTGRSEARRAGGYYYFMANNMRWAVIHEYYQSGKIVLCDESLSHRIFLLLPWSASWLTAAEEYYRHMPAPDGVVYVDGDADLVRARIDERNASTRKLIPGHMEADETELMSRIEGTLALARTGAAVLEDRGVSVLKLDGRQPASSNVARIQYYIKQIT